MNSTHILTPVKLFYINIYYICVDVWRNRLLVLLEGKCYSDPDLCQNYIQI